MRRAEVLKEWINEPHGASVESSDWFRGKTGFARRRNE